MRYTSQLTLRKETNLYEDSCGTDGKRSNLPKRLFKQHHKRMEGSIYKVKVMTIVHIVICYLNWQKSYTRFDVV